MKKSTIIIGAVFAMSLTACQKELRDIQEPQDYAFAIEATRESCADDAVGTKASISDAALSWTAGESISIYNGSEFKKATTLVGGAEAVFYSDATITPSKYAVYPASLSASLSSDDVKVTLPDAYENYKSGEAYPAMLAAFTGTPSSLSFKHLGGLVKFNVTGLPKDITKFIFTTTNDMPVTGEFTVTEESSNKVIKSAVSAGTIAKTVTYTFSNTEDSNDMVFYLPLPVLASDSQYKFSIDFQTDANVSIYGDTPRTGWVKIERAKYTEIKLGFTGTGGSAETGSTSVTVPSSATSYSLPSTDGTVNVTMEENNNDVTIGYSGEGLRPATVNVICKGGVGSADGTGLTINLPESHVTVKSSSTNTITITSLDSKTSASTLVLDKTVTIGKKLTISAGSAEIACTVPEVVVAAKAEGDTSEDEVTITLSEGANVTTSLTVAQGNVAIEKGSTVKAVSVAASVSAVTIAAAVEKVTVAAATSGEDTSAAPVIKVAETGKITTTLENNNANTTVVAANTATGTGGQIAKISGTSSSITIKTPSQYLASQIEKGGEITLDDSVTGNFTIASGNAVINLNGKTISGASEGNHATFTVNSGASLTINGEGNITNTVSGKPAIANNGTLTVNGGTYSAAASQSIIENGGTLSIAEGIEIASVKESDSTISAYVASEGALSAALSSEVNKIVLTKDIALVEAIRAKYTLTLDLNGKTVSPASDWKNYVSAGNGSDALIIVNRGGSLTITGNGTVDTGSANDKLYAAIKLTEAGEATTGTKAALTIVNGTFAGYYYAICGNGTRHDTELTINGGKFTSKYGIAVYHPQDGKFTVNGGTFTGADSAIELRAGTLNITGGTFTATASEFSAKANGNGTTVVGAALAISQHTTDKDINVTVTGGTFKGVYALYEKDLQNKTGNVTVSVSGATLDGKVYSKHNSSLSTSEEVSDATSLVAAINNSNVNEITLYADINLSATLTINTDKTLVIDLGGKTLTGRTNIMHGNITFKNGKICNDAQPLNVYGSANSSVENYSVLTIKDDVTVTAKYNAVCMFGNAEKKYEGYGAVINIAGTVYTKGDSTSGAVFVEGNLGKNADTEFASSTKNFVNITGKVTSDTDAAIALHGSATVNVNVGATVTGYTGVAVKRGKLIVNGGTINGTGKAVSGPAAVFGATEMTGSAVSATDTYSADGPLSVELKNGVFTSAAYTILNNSSCAFNISGGEFTSTLKDGAIVVWARLGSINIAGGEFTNNSNEEATIYVGTTAEKLGDKRPCLTVSGENTVVKNKATGAYKWNTALAPLTVNMHNEIGTLATPYKAVSISGGTFHGNNPSQDDDVTTDCGNFLAKGYEATATSDNVWVVAKAKN